MLVLFSVSLLEFALAATFCADPNKFCIVSTMNEKNENQTCFTIHSAQAGWAAIGLGTSVMKGSDMYIGWKNGTNSSAVFNYDGTGNVTPDPSPSQSAVASIPPLLGKKNSSKLILHF